MRLVHHHIVASSRNGLFGSVFQKPVQKLVLYKSPAIIARNDFFPAPVFKRAAIAFMQKYVNIS